MHRRSEISPVASCLVHEEKLSPFDMFHKLKFIEQCNCVITFIQWKDDGWLGRGGDDGLDSELYHFILDSRQLEAAVGSNELFISCHVLGSVDVMLRFIHAVGLLKLAVLVPVHACTQQIILVFVCGKYVPTLAYLWYLVRRSHATAPSSKIV
jgi:hypothetical protein